MQRRKVLISAYACEPGRGSEPGVGWNIAKGMAAFHDVWVLTRAKNRSTIEAEMEKNPISNLQFAYYDIPRWLSWWKKDSRGIQVYYYMWQVGVFWTARRLHKRLAFDIAHHVTFVKYWAPSLLALLGIPFVWGPVGGGESAPRAMLNGVGVRGRIYESARTMAQWLGERDPLVRLTATRSSYAIATTPETAVRLSRLQAKNITVLGACALTDEEIAHLGSLPGSRNSRVTFVSICRLLHWKGLHLGIRAFALASVPNARYVIIGSGPEGNRLKALAKKLGVEKQVDFTGRLPRENALGILGQSHVLVHPSLHDSGGWVCIEAMAAGRPVLCLDLGGPATQVTQGTGVKIAANTVDDAIQTLSVQMQYLAGNQQLREDMGRVAKQHVRSNFRWCHKAAVLDNLYASLPRTPIM